MYKCGYNGSWRSQTLFLQEYNRLNGKRTLIYIFWFSYINILKFKPVVFRDCSFPDPARATEQVMRGLNMS